MLVIARLSTPGVWPGPIYAYMFFPLLVYFLAGAMFYLAVFLCRVPTGALVRDKVVSPVAAIPAWFVAAELSAA